MGNWHISIEGVGPHHNVDHDLDANKMATQFVNDLKKAGHHVMKATFTHGGSDDLQGPTIVGATK